ncbi:Gfo/Idh/MocA family protein [Streptomyces sp. NPDC088350]|uniref:Gfo/Idh/MocA family protein n=1 Tax=Streptomyces sp. NPDC088350 TaxID=3365854 RepID=UPI00381AF427
MAGCAAGGNRPAQPACLPRFEVSEVATLQGPRESHGLVGGGHGFGIIGAGTAASFHARAILTLPSAQLMAVTDIDAIRAQGFADAHGCAAEPTLDDLLARRDIDVVCVCVPSGLHAEVGIAAARAGKHLVLEKPIDVHLEAADGLIEAADAAGVRMTVISQHRFDPALIKLRHMIDHGAFGRLLLGQASTKWYRSQSYYDSAAWRGTWAMDGGALMNQGFHYADLLLWCMGPAAEVSAVTATQAHSMEAEDCALAIVRFESGALGTITASTAVVPGFGQRLEISGTSGTVIIEDGDIIYQWFSNGAPDGFESADPAASTGVSLPGVAADAADLNPAAHAAQIADLLAAIDEVREPRVTGADGRATLELVCAIYESALQGASRVTFPVPRT